MEISRELLPHQALGDAAEVHGDHVEEDPQGGGPEVEVGQLFREKPGPVDARHDEVEHGESQPADAGQRLCRTQFVRPMVSMAPVNAKAACLWGQRCNIPIM